MFVIHVFPGLFVCLCLCSVFVVFVWFALLLRFGLFVFCCVLFVVCSVFSFVCLFGCLVLLSHRVCVALCLFVVVLGVVF